VPASPCVGGSGDTLDKRGARGDHACRERRHQAADSLPCLMQAPNTWAIREC
jgi:hypothetical protein